MAVVFHAVELWRDGLPALARPTLLTCALVKLVSFVFASRGLAAVPLQVGFQTARGGLVTVSVCGTEVAAL